MWKKAISWLYHKTHPAPLPVKSKEEETSKKEKATPLPLIQEGDVLSFTGGNRYRVVITKGMKCTYVSLAWVNRPVIQRLSDNPYRNQSWSSLRALQYWVEQRRGIVQTVTKTEYSKKDKDEWDGLTVDEAHARAIEFEQNRTAMIEILKQIKNR